MRPLRGNKMKLLILLQVLIAAAVVCNAEGNAKTALGPNGELTSIAAEEAKKSGSTTATHLFDSLSGIESDGNNLDFDYDDEEDSLKADGNLDLKEQQLQEVLLKAMKKPAIRKQIGEVIPILRVMSPAQRLTLAAMVSSQIMSQNTLSEESLTGIAAMFANKNLENNDERHNITEHLLLPISMDIAKMFKGLGKEMGRNLRQDFYRPFDARPAESVARRVTRKPVHRHPVSINRRMDEGVDEGSEERFSTKRPTAEALKQPGRDECDFFTKSLCLEVSNYPTEAIMQSLKQNEDIAKTFLTDFETHPTEEGVQESRGYGNGRRLERRQDGQNEVQDFAPEGGGYMCPSSVKYARPKRARTTSGQWKYIVNAGDYTQTLRLEICQKPKSPCSYVTNHLNSQCTQIYNYHRLLTWDEGKGLHMDIFKVPSCCSCHIQGYSSFFPPNQDFTFAEKRREPPEGPHTVSEPPNRPFYGFVSNKREVPKFAPSGHPATIQNQSLLLGNPKEVFPNLVDHLVPPGPPLPLENEGAGNPYLDSKYSKKPVPLDSNRKYPVQAAEYRRIIHKVAEGHDPLSPSSRFKAPIPDPDRANLQFSQPQHPEIPRGPPQEQYPPFNSTNPMRFPKPLPITPLPFPGLEIKTEKTNSKVFISTKPEPILHLGPKVNPRPPAQYFSPEFHDSASLPSKISPSFATPPKPGIVTRVSTTPKPPLKPDHHTPAQKKINYNYHPIIDFFLSDTKKRQAAYAGPQYLPLPAQDWTPVVGH